jgi:hypothetical protein
MRMLIQALARFVHDVLLLKLYCSFSYTSFFLLRQMLMILVLFLGFALGQTTLFHGKMRIAVACSGLNEHVFVADRVNGTARPSLMLNVVFGNGVVVPTTSDIGDGVGWLRGSYMINRPKTFVVMEVCVVLFFLVFLFFVT